MAQLLRHAHFDNKGGVRAFAAVHPNVGFRYFVGLFSFVAH